MRTDAIRLSLLLAAATALGLPRLAAAEPSAERGPVLLSEIGVSLSGSPAGAAPIGGFATGYKRGRALLALGAEYGTHLSSSAGTGPGGTAATVQVADHAVLLGPLLQIAILRSADGAAELLLHTRLGVGYHYSRADVGSETAELHGVQLAYQVGPGFRYWLRPRLAVHLLGGLRVGHTFFLEAPSSTQTGPGPGVEHMVGLFTSLGLTGVI